MSARSAPGALGLLAFATGTVVAAWAHLWLRWTSLSPQAAGAPAHLVGGALLAAIAAGAVLADGRTAHGADGPLTGRRAGTGLLALAAIATAVTLALPYAGRTTPLAIAAGAIAAGATLAPVALQPGALLLGGATGFGLTGLGLPLGGLELTTRVVCGVTVVLGVWTILVGRAGPPPEPGRPDGIVFFVAVLLGAYALVVHGALVAYVGDSVYARAAFVTTALLGPAIGIGASSAVRRTSRATGGLLFAAAVGALVSAALYASLEWVGPAVVRRVGGIASWPRAVALTGVEAGALLLPATLPLGAILGLRMRSSPQVGWAVVGASLALVATPLLLARIGPPGGLAAVGLLTPASGPSPFTERYGPLLYLSSSSGTTVLVTDDPEQGRLLRLGDGRTRGGVGTDAEDRVGAQIPLLLHPAPRRVLQLGFRTGNGASSILAHPIERLDVIDPLGEAAAIAPFFEESNLDVLSDQRLVLHVAEPWSFLSRTDQTWDVIRLFAGALEQADGEELPTQDRLELARERLADGGLVSLELNVGRTSDEEIRSVLRTMLSVFPDVSVWDGPLGYTWTIIGSEAPREPRAVHLAERLADPDVDAELGALGLGDEDRFAGRLALDARGARDLAAGAPPVTTDWPHVDDLGARSPYTFFGLGGAVADTPLADLTSPDGRENVGLERLFDRLHRMQAIERAPASSAPK